MACPTDSAFPGFVTTHDWTIDSYQARRGGSQTSDPQRMASQMKGSLERRIKNSTLDTSTQLAKACKGGRDTLGRQCSHSAEILELFTVTASLMTFNLKLISCGKRKHLILALLSHVQDPPITGIMPHMELLASGSATCLKKPNINCNSGCSRWQNPGGDLSAGDTTKA